MQLSTIDIGIFILYIIGVISLGVYASRQGKSTKRDYFLAGDKLPWWMIGGSIMAANISSHHLVGAMGVAHTKGFIAVYIEWGAILMGFNALLWIFLPFYIRNGFYTVPEFLQKRFGSSARTTYAALILLTYIFVEIGAVLYLGALSLYKLFDIPILMSVLVMALLTGIYTIAGGLRAVIWTEMLQLSILLIGGTVLSIATVNAAGGFSAIVESSKSWQLIYPADDKDFPWTMFLGGSLSVSIFYCATNQFVVQRVLAAKNEWHARMGVIFATYLKFLFPLIIVVPGLVAYKIVPDLDKPDLLFATLVEKLLPTGIIGLVMAGLIAAIMSHVSGAVNSCTTILTMDIYLPHINKNATEKQAIRFGKIAGAIIIFAGILCSTLLLNYSDQPIFLLLLNIYGLFTPGIATMFLLGVLWKRTTTAGALTAGLITIPLSLIMQIFFSDIISYHNRTGIVFWVCIILCVVVSLLTKARPEEEIKHLIWNKNSLRLLPAERQQQKGMRNPFIWWAIVTGAVLSFYLVYA